MNLLLPEYHLITPYLNLADSHVLEKFTRKIYEDRKAIHKFHTDSI